MKCKCWSCKSGQLSPTYTYTRCPRLHGHDVMLPPDCVISDYVNTWYCHQHNTGPLNTDHYLLTISMSTPNYCNTVMMAAAKVTVTVKKHINGHWQLSEATILIENKNLQLMWFLTQDPRTSLVMLVVHCHGYDLVTRRECGHINTALVTIYIGL